MAEPRREGGRRASSLSRGATTSLAFACGASRLALPPKNLAPHDDSRTSPLSRSTRAASASKGAGFATRGLTGSAASRKWGRNRFARLRVFRLENGDACYTSTSLRKLTYGATELSCWRPSRGTTIPSFSPMTASSATAASSWWPPRKPVIAEPPSDYEDMARALPL